MRRRITSAIVGVTACVLLLLGIPLAIAAHASILDSEVVKLHSDAASTLPEVAVPFDLRALARVAEEPDSPPPFAIYDADGRLRFGEGPVAGDRAVIGALAGITTSTTDGAIVVGTPITDSTEHIVGVLRMSASMATVDRRSRTAWGVMVGVALLALALGWLIGRRLARSMAAPLSELAAAAGRLADGGVVQLAQASGIAEIDTLAGALTTSSQRTSDALARERQFSADVSHQLRTPVTGLRLRLEAARADADPAVIDQALDDLGRLQTTIDHLVTYARDSVPVSTTSCLDLAIDRAAERWHHRVRAAGRLLLVATDEPGEVIASSASIDQVLDVLVDNALHHGRGVIELRVRRIAGGHALDVADEGEGIPPGQSEEIFRRGHGVGTGIGLALARSMIDAEGGRLLLSNLAPTTFSVILLRPPLSSGG